MGYCDSPAQLRGDREFLVANRRTPEVDPSRRGSAHLAKLGASRSAGEWILLSLLGVYKALLSPFFGGACKYHPSCSNYAYEAIQRHGARRGVLLALQRLGRCRPFVPGGFDPVPSVDDLRAERSGGRTAEPVR